MYYNFDKCPKRIDSYKWNNLEYDDMLSMDIADMDFFPPKDILRMTVNALESTCLGYNYENTSYFDAIIRWYINKHKITIEKDCIVPTAGVITGIKLAVNAFSKKNDSVMVLIPAYHSYFDLVKNNNRKLICTPMNYNKNSYSVDFEHFAEDIKKENVKIFILNNPHNPTGKVFSASELETMLYICSLNDVVVISDEVYEDFVNNDVEFISCINYVHKYDNIIVAKSLCKTFSVAGVQVANMYIHNKKMRDYYMMEKRKHSSIANNCFGIVLTEKLLRYGEKWHIECLSYINENIRIFKEFVHNKCSDIIIIKSQALYMLWLDLSALKNKNEVFKEIFEGKLHLRFSYGSSFGNFNNCDNFIRINFACPRFIVYEMIDRLDKYINCE